MTDHGSSGPSAPMTGLSHVQLNVSDVGASAAWYTAALGLEPYAEDLDIGYVALRHRAAKAVFVLTRSSGDGGSGGAIGATDSETGSKPDGVLDHLAFAVPDGAALRAWAVHLTEVGITHPGLVLENGNPTLQLRDPDGVAIELVAPAPAPS